VNGKTAMRKFKKILENGKNGVRGTKDKWNVIIYKLMINKHENICVVYWNDVSIPGWKLSWW
jgi:hypothetical protein